MSDFCDFVPDDPSCQTTEPEPEPTNTDGSMEGGDMEKDHDDDMMEMEGNPMMGNLTYLHVALFSTIHAGLELFVYHEDDEYDDGEVLGTNYWKYFSSLHHYSHFGIMSILTVTQILSMVGIAGEINIMAWAYAEMIEMVLQLILKLGFMYTYDAAYVIKEADGTSAADVAKAESVMEEIAEAVVNSTIEETGNHFALHVEHHNWMMAQVMALPEEAQEKYMHKKKGHDDHDDHEGHDDEMIALLQKHTGYFML